VNIADGVVLVLTSQGSLAGTGFVVSDTLLVTCSHVVQQCDAQDRNDPRTETVRVIFHATGDTRDRRVSAEAAVVDQWWRGCEQEDIAFLRVNRVPDGVVILALGSADGVDRDEIHTFGYPDAGQVEGLGGEGRVVQHVKESGRPLLQLSSSEITSGFSGAPLWDRQKRRVIGVVTSILPSDRYGKLGETAFATPTTVLQAICPALQVSDVCPYFSLNAFGADDAEFFFGRERLVEKLLSKLRANPRFLALLGPSGSGKSSVIRAGLVPRLAAGDIPGSHTWGMIVIRPGADPFTEIGQAGLGGGQLADSLRQWMQASSYQRAVLIIDQFEELLATTRASVRADFIAQLSDLLDSSLPVTVVLVMRNDFYSQLGDSAPGLLRWVEEGLVNVLSLDRNELVEIIAEPARRVGLDFQEGLVEVIVGEAMVMPAEGAAIPSTILPLVEFALTELWDQSRRDGMLTHEAYRTLGGISGALTQWADNTYHELDDSQRLIARSIFLDLVHVADEKEGVPDTRERRDIGSLCPVVDDRGSVEAVVNHLAVRRLVIVSRTEEGPATVELVHDALIREWGPLRAWLSEERPFRMWLQETESALRSWISFVQNDHRGEEPDWLRGRHLVQAEDWLGSRAADISDDLKEFIHESVKVRDEEAERERKRQASERERQQALNISESLRLASEARQVMQPEPDTALLVAWEAVLRNRNEITEGVFREALSEMPAPMKILWPLSGYWDVNVGFASNGDWIFATHDKMGSIDIWDIEGSHINRFTVPGSGDMTAVSVPGTPMLLTCRDCTIRLYGTDGSVLDELALIENASDDFASREVSLSVTETGICLAYLNDRSWIIRIDLPGRSTQLLRSITFTSEDERTALYNHSSGIFDVRIDRQAQNILTKAVSAAAGLWALDGSLRAVLQYEGSISTGEFIADNRIVIGTTRGAGYLWDAGGSALGIFRPGGDSWINNLNIRAVTSDREYFAATAGDSGVTEVRNSSGELAATLRGHEGLVVCGAFSPDGHYLATGGRDHAIRVYDWRQEATVFEMRGQSSEVSQLAFHPTNSSLLLCAGFSGNVQLFTLETAIIPPLRGHEKAIDMMTLTPAGVLSSSADGTCRIWRPDGSSVKLAGDFMDWVPASQTSIFLTGNHLIPDYSEVVAGRNTPTIIYHSAVSESAASTQSKVSVSGFSGSDKVSGILSFDGSQFVLIGGWDAYLHSRSDGQIAELRGQGQDTIISAGFLRGGSVIFTAAENGIAWLWNPDGSPIGAFRADRDRALDELTLDSSVSRDDVIMSVGLDPRGEYILFGLRNSVRFWTWDGRLQHEIHPPGYKVKQIKFLPDSSHFITISDSESGAGFAALWDREGDLVASLDAPGAGTMTEICCDPHGRYLCFKDSAIRIFDIDGHLITTLEPARGMSVVDIAIRGDGELVAALFSDGSARIWEFNSKRRIMTLTVGEATRICFSSDSTRLLAASADGIIEQYALDIEDIFPAAAARIGRGLTAREINRFAIQQPVKLDLDSYYRSHA
jgi:WD40 repeat protein